MKQLAAIVFSLLLIAAQTVAVQVPVSGGVAVVEPCCCCADCQCCVSSSGGPSVPPVQSTTSVSTHNQFVLPPVAAAIFGLAAPADEFPPASANAELRAAAVPLFQRNCVFLI